MLNNLKNMKYLEKLRQKNEEEKRRIAFSGSLIITSFIVLIWIFSSFVGSNNLDNKVENLANPLSSLTQDIKNIFK